jgi:hypothetical protein
MQTFPMTSRSTLGSFLLLASVAVAACGGASAAQMPAGDASTMSTDAPQAEVTIVPDAVSSNASGDVAGDSDNSASGASDVVISGDLASRVSGPGTCGLDAFTGEDWSAAFDNTGGDFDYETDELWILSLDINQYPGAGTFAATKGSTVGKAEIRLSNGMLKSYESKPGGGSLTIDAGDRSGSIEATLNDSDSGATVTVKGSWACEPA